MVARCKGWRERRLGLRTQRELLEQAAADGRWQVIRTAWRAELREALKATKGNLEIAVAIATTMVFAD
jgi:hypothetical protein